MEEMTTETTAETTAEKTTETINELIGQWYDNYSIDSDGRLLDGDRLPENPFPLLRLDNHAPLLAWLREKDAAEAPIAEKDLLAFFAPLEGRHITDIEGYFERPLDQCTPIVDSDGICTGRWIDHNDEDPLCTYSDDDRFDNSKYTHRGYVYDCVDWSAANGRLEKSSEGCSGACLNFRLQRKRKWCPHCRKHRSKNAVFVKMKKDDKPHCGPCIKAKANSPEATSLIAGVRKSPDTLPILTDWLKEHGHIAH
jgi:hypothetical protein